MSVEKGSLVLAYLPSPDRGVWMIGPVPIRAYALCIIAGILVAVLWGERRFVARGGAPGTVTDVAVFAVPFGLVGGRLYHVLTDWKTYFGPGGNPVDALRIWHGGLGIWGAIALGAVGAWIGCRRHKVPLPFFADAVAPGIVTAQAIGRLGNWFNQELYGGPTTLPWGLEIYRRVDPKTGITDSLGGVAVDRTPIAIVQPTFLYELLWNLVVAALVVWADRRFRLGHGRAFAVYVAGYTFGRFFIELLRTDPATRVFGGLRINVVVAAVVFVGAVVYLLVVRKPREVPPFDSRRPWDGTEAAGAETAGADPDGADAIGAGTAGADELPEPFPGERFAGERFGTEADGAGSVGPGPAGSESARTVTVAKGSADPDAARTVVVPTESADAARTVAVATESGGGDAARTVVVPTESTDAARTVTVPKESAEAARTVTVRKDSAPESVEPRPAGEAADPAAETVNMKVPAPGGRVAPAAQELANGEPANGESANGESANGLSPHAASTRDAPPRDTPAGDAAGDGARETVPAEAAGGEAAPGSTPPGSTTGRAP